MYIDDSPESFLLASAPDTRAFPHQRHTSVFDDLLGPEERPHGYQICFLGSVQAQNLRDDRIQSHPCE